MNPRISIIVSVTKKHRSIGDKGRLIATISDDLKRFKRLTMGHPIIMGRKTFESIGKALPGRSNYVITRNKGFRAPDVTTCLSVDEAIKLALKEEMNSKNSEKEIFLIGGGEIYMQGLPVTGRLYLTLVESDAKGDVTFPDYSDFKIVLAREDRRDEKTGLTYSWIDLER